MQRLDGVHKLHAAHVELKHAIFDLWLDVVELLDYLLMFRSLRSLLLALQRQEVGC